MGNNRCSAGSWFVGLHSKHCNAAGCEKNYRNTMLYVYSSEGTDPCIIRNKKSNFQFIKNYAVALAQIAWQISFNFVKFPCTVQVRRIASSEIFQCEPFNPLRGCMDSGKETCSSKIPGARLLRSTIENSVTCSDRDQRFLTDSRRNYDHGLVHELVYVRSVCVGKRKEN